MGTIRKLKSWRAVGELSFPKQDTHLQVMQLIAAALSVQHPHTRRGKAVVRAPPPPGGVLLAQICCWPSRSSILL